jgi:3-dehydroquinate dehydratase-1
MNVTWVSRPPIKVRGRVLGDGKVPLIITPLVGKTTDAILHELAEVLAKRPDIVEWRADFYADIASAGAVIELARRMKAKLGATPLLFTIRSAREGGQQIRIAEEAVVDLHAAMCRSALADIVDYELGNAPERLQQVRNVSRETGTPLILSYHDFQSTPALNALIEKFVQAEREGADVAKVAVMPASLHDVLVLLQATLSASERLRIPLISMSMGSLGSLSRLAGWMFGSAATFAVGAGSSAPGQVAIEELRAAIEIARKAIDTRT